MLGSYCVLNVEKIQFFLPKWCLLPWEQIQHPDSKVLALRILIESAALKLNLEPSRDVCVIIGDILLELTKASSVFMIKLSL